MTDRLTDQRLAEIEAIACDADEGANTFETIAIVAELRAARQQIATMQNVLEAIYPRILDGSFYDDYDEASTLCGLIASVMKDSKHGR